MQYTKRLIEVDLPIKRISKHARREKSIRHGHISTLHIWWARRPLAACRAVLCAALWPDPADDNCPVEFRIKARELMQKWSDENLDLVSPESFSRFVSYQKYKDKLNDHIELRIALLNFIADFSSWNNSINRKFIETSHILTKYSQLTIGRIQDTRPIVIDPFAGGGSIPLEAIRIGADVFASDINPVATIQNRLLLEYIPRYGNRLLEKFRECGEKIAEEARKELRNYYFWEEAITPVAYIWARTINCEGPGCGAKIPLIRSLWLRKKSGNNVVLNPIISKDKKSISFDILHNPSASTIKDGTVKRSSCNCPICGFTTPAKNVRLQFEKRNGGADDAQLVAVVNKSDNDSRKLFRAVYKEDIEAFKRASEKLNNIVNENASEFSIIPNETLPYLRSIFNINLLGVDEWGKLYNRRQLLSLVTIVKLTKEILEKESKNNDPDFTRALSVCLTLAVGRCADYWSSLSVWAGDFVAHTFGRQALGIIWDYAEVYGFSGSTGDYGGAINWISRVLERESTVIKNVGHVELSSATKHPLPDDSVQAFITDPPYYDAVPYADLSDYFYVWFKRILNPYFPEYFSSELTQKDGEIVQLAERNKKYSYKTKEYFENLMILAMAEGRRVLAPNGIGVVVFAHKTTEGWETQLNAMIEAGWVITASWPIDTERPGRLRANNSAALASSIHLVCRPRENPDGSIILDNIGDWRDILQELPSRIHEWMPRLSDEGVVGADAIFACLGPALEIFSRYSYVEKTNGDRVELREYLEHVWAAVSKEALNMVFEDADAGGLEEDARLTAIWLWTISTAANGKEEEEEEEEIKSTGYELEYDAARKISQGLGIHMEDLSHLVETKGDKSKLLAVGDRTNYLFGKDEGEIKSTRKKKKVEQQDFFADLSKSESETGWGTKQCLKSWRDVPWIVFIRVCCYLQLVVVRRSNDFW